jgi:hypothetical protein
MLSKEIARNIKCYLKRKEYKMLSKESKEYKMLSKESKEYKMLSK